MSATATTTATPKSNPRPAKKRTTTTTRAAKPATASGGKPKRPTAADVRKLDGAIEQYRQAIADHERSMESIDATNDIARRLEAANDAIAESVRRQGIASAHRDGQTFGDGRTVVDFPATPSGRPACQVGVVRRSETGTAYREWFIACRSMEDWKRLAESEPFFRHFHAVEFAFGVVATARLYSLAQAMKMDAHLPRHQNKEWSFLTESEFATPFPQR
jgi:hypothetical protein